MKTNMSCDVKQHKENRKMQNIIINTKTICSKLFFPSDFEFSYSHISVLFNCVTMSRSEQYRLTEFNGYKIEQRFGKLN